VCVAQICAPYGVRGEVRLKSFTVDPKAVAHYGPLQTEDGRQSFEIEATLAQQKDALIVRLRGIGDRNAAEGLEPLAGPPTVLLPFTATAVPSVDIAGGRLVVAPPPDAPEPGEVLARKRSG
jgi:ribosomal 30S subunit maturation factor RimM